MPAQTRAMDVQFKDTVTTTLQQVTAALNDLKTTQTAQATYITSIMTAPTQNNTDLHGTQTAVNAINAEIAAVGQSGGSSSALMPEPFTGEPGLCKFQNVE